MDPQVGEDRGLVLPPLSGKGEAVNCEAYTKQVANLCNFSLG